MERSKLTVCDCILSFVIYQMFGAMKEFDELAVLEEIQKELISQGTKLKSHRNFYCYETGYFSSGNGSRSDFFCSMFFVRAFHH